MNKEIDDKIEDLELQQENYIHALKELQKAQNDIEDYEDDDLKCYVLNAIQEIERLIICIGDDIKELKDPPDEWDNDYEERMSEYRKMQGF